MKTKNVDKMVVDRTVDKDDDKRTWGERNGPVIYGISVFAVLFLVSALMWLAM